MHDTTVIIRLERGEGNNDEIANDTCNVTTGDWGSGDTASKIARRGEIGRKEEERRGTEGWERNLGNVCMRWMTSDMRACWFCCFLELI